MKNNKHCSFCVGVARAEQQVGPVEIGALRATKCFGTN